MCLSVVLELLLLSVGIVVALFVGFNIGGATTGPAFGPAVGANSISKVGAAALMSVFFFVGAWTIGRQVVDTLGNELITGTGIFTIESSIVVLFFIGGALFVGQLLRGPRFDVDDRRRRDRGTRRRHGHAELDRDG